MSRQKSKTTDVRKEEGKRDSQGSSDWWKRSKFSSVMLKFFGVLLHKTLPTCLHRVQYNTVTRGEHARAPQRISVTVTGKREKRKEAEEINGHRNGSIKSMTTRTNSTQKCAIGRNYRRTIRVTERLAGDGSRSRGIP